jgi:hypothetical protein
MEAPPPVFSDAPLAALIERAEAEGRWLVVDVTDATNPACHAVAYTTWRDGDLLAWLEANAIAVRVDARRDVDAARTLRVEPEEAPATLVLREGHERLRLFGRTSAADLLRRLERLDIAEDNLRLQRAVCRDPEHDMMAREGRAEALLRAGLLEDALAEFEWLWRHIDEVDPEMSGVRVSFMASRIGDLCRESLAARLRFRVLRDEAEAAARVAGPGSKARLDWIVLNEELGEEDMTLMWLAGVEVPVRASLSPGICFRLIRLLFARERWADAGPLITDPLGELEHAYLITAASFRAQARAVYRSLRAAGRDAEAAAVKEAALARDGSPAMRTALS